MGSLAEIWSRRKWLAILTFAWILCAALCVVIYCFARRLGYGARVASAVCLTLGLGTMLQVYARHDFGDPLASLALAASCLLVRRFADTGRPARRYLLAEFRRDR